MTQTSAGTNMPRPPLILSEEDHSRMMGLSHVIARRDPLVARLLQEEADRAELVPRESVPAGTVAVGSMVEFHDTGSGLTRRVQVVLPREADFSAGRISLVSLVGAGLIGLSRGQSIEWPMHDGQLRRLSVLDVGSAP